MNPDLRYRAIRSVTDCTNDKCPITQDNLASIRLRSGTIIKASDGLCYDRDAFITYIRSKIADGLTIGNEGFVLPLRAPITMRDIDGAGINRNFATVRAEWNRDPVNVENRDRRAIEASNEADADAHRHAAENDGEQDYADEDDAIDTVRRWGVQSDMNTMVSLLPDQIDRLDAYVRRPGWLGEWDHNTDTDRMHDLRFKNIPFNYYDYIRDNVPIPEGMLPEFQATQLNDRRIINLTTGELEPISLATVSRWEGSRPERLDRKGGHKSRKHKSRKHKSRKHKSRKHKSRKHKSRR
jgi:hypothetical protein